MSFLNTFPPPTAVAATTVSPDPKTPRSLLGISHYAINHSQGSRS